MPSVVATEMIKELRELKSLCVTAEVDQFDLGSGLLGRLLIAYAIGDKKMISCLEGQWRRNVIQFHFSHASLFAGLAGLSFVSGLKPVLQLENNLLAHERLRFAVEDVLEFDSMYGLAGVGQSVLRQSGDVSELVLRILKRFEEFRAPNNPAVLQSPSHRHLIDLGMSHGQAGYLDFLATISLRDPDLATLVQSAIEDQLKFFLSVERDHVRDGIWPSQIYESKTGGPKKPLNRQAWCYGAGGISVALYRAGLALSDAGVCEKAYEIFSCFIKKTLTENTIDNPFICHGAAGLALIARFFWYETGEEFANEQWRRWVDLSFSQWKQMSLKERSKATGILDGRFGLLLVWNDFIFGSKDESYFEVLRRRSA